MSHTKALRTIAGPALVIAPHPDDETLGCGGLIADLCQRGQIVHTIFVTDGSSSHRHSAAWSAKRLAFQREIEATQALELLGAGDQPRTHLALKDAAMPLPGSALYEQAIATILEVLTTLQPNLVLLPWRRDPHCDHRDSWSLLMDALSRSRQTPQILEYTIWLDELGVLDDFPATDEMERLTFERPGIVALKRRAIAAHRSQLGQLIDDDPSGFVLTEATMTRLIGPSETYWRPWPAQ